MCRNDRRGLDPCSALDALAVKEEAHRRYGDALPLAEGLHQVLQSRVVSHLEEDLVAILHSLQDRVPIPHSWQGLAAILPSVQDLVAILQRLQDLVGGEAWGHQKLTPPSIYDVWDAELANRV